MELESPIIASLRPTTAWLPTLTPVCGFGTVPPPKSMQVNRFTLSRYRSLQEGCHSPAALPPWSSEPRTLPPRRGHQCPIPPEFGATLRSPLHPAARTGVPVPGPLEECLVGVVRLGQTPPPEPPALRSQRRASLETLVRRPGFPHSKRESDRATPVGPKPSFACRQPSSPPGRRSGTGCGPPTWPPFGS